MENQIKYPPEEPEPPDPLDIKEVIRQARASILKNREGKKQNHAFVKGRHIRQGKH